MTCGDRCLPPFQPAGSNKDPLCVERFVNDQEEIQAGYEGENHCCVLITCAATLDEEDEITGPCRGKKCGPNAKCRHEVLRGESAESLCFWISKYFEILPVMFLDVIFYYLDGFQDF